MPARKKKPRSTVFLVSVGAHLLLGLILALVPQQKLREVVAIALNEAPKQEKKPEPPKPPPHPAERPSHAGHAPRGPVTASATQGPKEAAAFTDIGLALDSSSEDGLAINMAPPPAAPVVAAPVPQKPKILVARPTENTCTEELVKARPVVMARPSYTDAARRAHIEGRVRLELTIDDRGEVIAVRVLQGLGYGLDEAAVAAAKRLHFKPATRCKKAVAAPFFLAMRFGLGS